MTPVALPRRLNRVVRAYRAATTPRRFNLLSLVYAHRADDGGHQLEPPTR